MSSADFDALLAASPSTPEPAPEEPAPEEPAPEEPAPEVAAPEPVQPEPPAEPDPAPEPPPQPEPSEPLPEDLPVEALPQLIETPDPVAPIAEVEQPIPVPLSDVKPRPRPVDRVAATPVESVDAPEVADQVIDSWADGHVFLAWVLLWAVVFAATLVFAGTARRMGQRAMGALNRWSQAAAQRPKVRFVKVDSDACPQASMRHQVRSIPTLALFLKGQEIARVSGAMSAPQLLQWLDTHLASAHKGA